MRMLLLSASAGFVIAGTACTTGGDYSSAETNPLLAEWTGPHGGVPPLDKVKIEYFKPAIEHGMAEQLRLIDSITANPDAPTVENTLEPLEASSKGLMQTLVVYWLWSGNFSTPEFQKVESEMDPQLAAHSDKIMQNPELWARVKQIYDSRDGLGAEQSRLSWYYYNQFRRAGADLGDEQKARVAEINKELAGLFTKFNQNLLADEDTYITLTEAETEGLPESVKSAAAASAKDRKVDGHIVVNTRSSTDPFLTYATNRAAREKVWRAYVNRGDNGGTTDNNKIISQILQLRAERAKLLGYETHAHWRLEDAVAKNPDNAMNLMMQVWPAAVQRVKEEVVEMQAVANQEGADITIEPWDYHFYMEKVRKAKYDLDQNEVKPYLQLDQLRDGMFWAAGQIYGYQFTRVNDVPVPHEDFQTWQVTDTTGNEIGLFYFDPYARSGKRSGAWMTDYRPQHKLGGNVITLLSNNSNFVKGNPGEPILISWDDATTLFHEFGHALHGLSSKVTYPSLSGTNVARDYVEFPSQLNERWLPTTEVLTKFAVNAEGQPIPQELVDKIKKASTFKQGYMTVEYLASALIDMKLHLAGSTPIDPDTFERVELEKIGMPKEIVMRHRTPQFAHVFSSDGYSAGYYSYLWADAITADAVEAFQQAPGHFYDKPTATALHDKILSVGNTIDPAEAYRGFRGRDPDIGALMRARGFPASSQYVPLKAD